MSAELAVLIIHGMGFQLSDFAEDMIEELNDRVSGLGKDPEKIAWQPIHWADILADRQRQYLEVARRVGDLDYMALRRLMVSGFGDACAYQKVESKQNTTYQKIHKRVAEDIQSVYKDGLQSSAKPLIILAHSLGGHIISNYIWDMQKAKKNTQPSNEFERMERLSGIITFGCNIPLFTFAYDNVEPIEFPPEKLPPELKKKAKWLNYYDPDDVLGYPLKAINADYKKTVTKDISINVGGIFSSWNPFSHVAYWTDSSFTKPVAKFIADFLQNKKIVAKNRGHRQA